MGDIRKVPKLRFDGFSAEWEQCKLGKNYKIIMGQSPLSENYTDDTSDHILVQGNADMKNGYVYPRVYTKQVTKTADKGDLILSVRAPVGDVGKTDYNVVIGRGVAAIKGNEFLFQQLTQMNIKGYWNKYSTGSTFESINSNDIKDAAIYLPNQEEQSKIGNLFYSLDHLIILHQNELDHIEMLKKALLQKLFVKNNETIPEIRFNGFTKEWEQCKLGELMNITSVKRIHQSDWTDSGVRFLRARDLVSASKGEEPDDYLYISESKYDEYSNVSGKVQVGDLLVTGVGSIGVPMLIDHEKPIYFKDGNIIWFKNQNKINGNFFYYSFTGCNIQKYIRDVAGTGTVGTYTIDSGKKTPISLPIFKEQQKIGSFFKLLDHLITLHQHKVNKLIMAKNSLLQQMFI